MCVGGGGVLELGLEGGEEGDKMMTSSLQLGEMT